MTEKKKAVAATGYVAAYDTAIQGKHFAQGEPVEGVDEREFPALIAHRVIVPAPDAAPKAD